MEKGSIVKSDRTILGTVNFTFSEPEQQLKYLLLILFITITMKRKVKSEEKKIIIKNQSVQTSTQKHRLTKIIN